MYWKTGKADGRDTLKNQCWCYCHRKYG